MASSHMVGIWWIWYDGVKITVVTEDRRCGSRWLYQLSGGGVLVAPPCTRLEVADFTRSRPPGP